MITAKVQRGHKWGRSACSADRDSVRDRVSTEADTIPARPLVYDPVAIEEMRQFYERMGFVVETRTE